MYKKLFQSHDSTQDTIAFKLFQVPIGNSKCVETFKFYNDSPILKYLQKSFNSYCFSSLASAFVSIKKIKAVNAISLRIEESLKSKMVNRIDFANAILKNEKIIKREPKVHYSLITYKKKVSYDILTDISEHVTLVQLMDSLGNVNHDISVVGYLILDSNYKRALVINRESLDMIYALSVDE